MGNESADTVVDAAVSRRMSNTRGRDSKPELAIRRNLHAAGLRYRVDARPVSTSRRSADIVFPTQKIAVLIDGCFWHACPDHYRPAKSVRTEFWAKKIDQNHLRDVESTALFEEAGWTVLRFWEHENPEDVVRGHEKVSTGGQLRSPLVAMKSPRWWPREVLTPY